MPITITKLNKTTEICYELSPENGKVFDYDSLKGEVPQGILFQNQMTDCILWYSEKEYSEIELAGFTIDFWHCQLPK